MRIDERLADGGEPSFSFEFFPPRTDEGERNLGRALAELSRMDPTFVSVTYGAAGSTTQKRKTVDIVSSIKATHGLEAMAHFTCVGATVGELREMLDAMRDAGIKNVLALRGDPPAGETEWKATEGGLEYSRELIELIRDEYDFTIGAACFPEVHIHAESAESDLRYCKEKVDAGARFLITQLFFENATYWEFVARAREAGIDVPIIPGIMPITSYSTRSAASPACADRTSPTTCCASSACAPTSRTRWPTSASPTRPSSAPTCSPRARRGSTSTRSTAPPPRARSSARCAAWRPGGTPCRLRHGAPQSDSGHDGAVNSGQT